MSVLKDRPAFDGEFLAMRATLSKVQYAFFIVGDTSNHSDAIAAYRLVRWPRVAFHLLSRLLSEAHTLSICDWSWAQLPVTEIQGLSVGL